MTDEELLIERENYLAHGVHIGTRSRNKDMEDFIFRVKKNQLAVLNLEKTDERIRYAAEFLSHFGPEDILVVGRKESARQPLKMFSEALGTKNIVGRFMPGTLTNPNSDNFMEPEVVVVTDREEDKQVIDEAVQTNIPVVALVDSDDNLDDIDVPIPCNNKAENSIGLVYYLLAQETADELGVDFEYKIEDFRPGEIDVEEE